MRYQLHRATNNLVRTILCGAILCAANLAAAQSGNATEVTAFEISVQPFTDSIEAIGTLKAQESVTLSVTVTEKISAIHFDDGQQVTKGKVLVEMTSSEEQAMLEELDSAAVEAKRQFNRLTILKEQQLVAEELLDQSRQQYDAARSRQLAMQSRLDDRLIIAPFSGVVGLRNVSIGELVTPGDSIVTLDDTTAMRLDINLPAPYLSKISAKLPIQAQTVAVDSQIFAGIVTAIDSRIDPITRTITVRAMLPNPDSLLIPGMLMTVIISSAERQSLLVPELALVRQGDVTQVYIIGENNIIESRNVTTGGRATGQVEITSGLKLGEEIVNHGVLKVRPGSKIKILNSSPADSAKTKPPMTGESV
ncbi:MAG: membrane fusion protein (multidrug efflux system) [Pseudomonadales bacterium]|jgi:membrane fusion protein (multidrug efflux system)